MDAKFNSEIFRKNFPIILAKNPHLASLDSVRLAYDAAGYKCGQVLARNSTSGLYQKYANGGASGTGTAKAVLFEDMPVELFASSGDTQLARGIFKGELFYAKLVGSDATAETNLGARRYIGADGIEILTF